jgi:membrane protein
VLRGFDRDGCPQAAGALSYSTVLALVPMLAVMFTTLAAVPGLTTWHAAIEDFVFENFLPARGALVRDHIRAFVAQAESLQILGLASLAISAIAMMSTVETAFNAIWKVEKPREWWHRGGIYVALLAFGPLTLTLMLATTSLAVGTPMIQRHITGAPSAVALAVMPLISVWVLFAAGYRLVPNRPVALRDALHGGALAALLFEGAKRGFAFYIAHFPQQQLIYGAFAAIPLFLVWLYVAWTIVLFGAEFTHELALHRPPHAVDAVAGNPVDAA